MAYIDSTELAQDNRSSAWALMIVGGVGLVAAVLCITGVLPFKIGNSYIFYGLGLISLIFLVMGFVSLKNAKTYAKKAESEQFLQNTILEWCKENLHADEIKAEVEDYSVVPDEVIYFRRVECIKNKINRQFMNVDQNFIDHFIDETIYDMVFEEKTQE